MNNKIIMMFLVLAMGVGGFYYYNSNNSETAAREMRLEKYVGSVALKNAGEAKEVVEGARLISGDDLSTETSSNAYILLDESKILTVDELSNIEITKNQEDLDVYLHAGSVFFNVTQTLAENESLDFHTNNIVTGVRGTSGIITYEEDQRKSQIVVLEGVVEVETIHEVAEISTGEVGIATTLEDGTVNLEILVLEEEPIPYYYSDFFVEQLQETASLSLLEELKEPEAILLPDNIKVLANNRSLSMDKHKPMQTWFVGKIQTTLPFLTVEMGF